MNKAESGSTLAPLPGVVELIKSTHNTIKKKPKVFFGIAVIPSMLFLSMLVPMIFWPSPIATGFVIILGIVATISSILSSIAIILAFQKNLQSIKVSYTESIKYFWSIIWVNILVSLAILVGFILFVIPGIYLAIALAFANYILIVENIRGSAALTRSRELVQGRWFAIAGRLIGLGLAVLVVYLLGGAIIGGISLLAPESYQNWEGVMNGYGFILEVLTTPYTVGFTYYLYVALKGNKIG